MLITLRLRSLVWFVTGATLMLGLALAVATAWPADAAPGDSDTTFVPIAPCRLFDYRQGAGISPREVPIGAQETVVQQVTGAVGACNIPTTATGVALNVTVTAGTATSNLRVFPADMPVPNASNLNWVAGQGPTPNKVDVKLSAVGAIGIYNDFGTVVPFADATGYYTRTSLQELARSRSFAVQSGGDQYLTLSTPYADTTIRSVTVTAPVAGTVTVASVAPAFTADPWNGAACSISTTAEYDDAYQQGWRASSDVSAASLGIGQMAGSRVIPVEAGGTITANLVCYLFANTGNIILYDTALTATFNPAP